MTSGRTARIVCRGPPVYDRHLRNSNFATQSPPEREIAMRAAAFASLAALATLLAVPLAAPLAAAPYEIRLLGGELQPAEMSAAERAAVAARIAGAHAGSAGDRSAGGRTHILVQFREVPGEVEQASMRDRGLDLGAYVPDRAWVAAVPVDQLAAVAAREDVRWMGAWDASRKVHPNVAAGNWGKWTVDATRDEYRATFRMTFVQLHHDVDLGRIGEIAAAHDGVAMEPVQGLHGATVWIPAASIPALAGEEDVLWIEEGPMPLGPTNDGVRQLLHADPLNVAPYGVNGLDGTGVRVFVFDVGRVKATHDYFKPPAGRVTGIDATAVEDHSTHVAGTVGGDDDSVAPASSHGRGVAPGTSIISAGFEQVAGTMLFWDNAGDIEADYTLARQTHHADVATNSLGSNAASNGYDCAREGDYGVASALLDGIVRGDNAPVGGPVLVTWANGNERDGGVSGERGRCGSNYATTAPPSCAKNPLQVGALSTDGGAMTIFSSWGPCDDGRMKPIVAAGGCETGRKFNSDGGIFSALAGSDSADGVLCGTSMATPAVAGVAALFIEEWRALGFGGANARPLPALFKAMVIHTARDLGTDGPDYSYGYGNVEAKALIDLLDAGDPLASGNLPAFGTDSVGNGVQDDYTFVVPAGLGELRASLAWDDKAAAAFAATALVNDLDLTLIAPDSNVHRAWVLNPAAGNRQNPATQGTNTRDNQEQVVVQNPAAGTWTVRVRGTTVPNGPQTYGLAVSSLPVNVGGGCSNLIINSGFETDTTGWTLGDATRVAAPAAGHGSFSLEIGDGGGSGFTATDLTIPAGTSRAELKYFWRQTTNEGVSGFGWDQFFTEIRTTAGVALAIPDQRNDGWLAGTWLGVENIDLTPYIGQTIRLRFVGDNGISRPTRFWIDDVTVDVCTSLLLADGFETGNVSAWSAGTP